MGEQLQMPVATSKGAVRLPAYLPVTTFGSEYPLDSIIRPFLRRFADMLMVSYHYAKEMPADVDMPVFIDSGGFAVLMEGARIVETAEGLGAIRRALETEEEEITPQKVLALQEQLAQWGSTLDFPIPPGLEDAEERDRRLRLTLANARWAMANRPSGSLRLFGSVQGWDEASYIACAEGLLAMGFTDLAIGGLVPRASDRALVLAVARGVRAAMGPDGVLHAFGMGEISMVRDLFAAGVSSVDSSSFVRAAASGKRWDGGWTVECPSALERAHWAIANYRRASDDVGAGNGVQARKPAISAVEEPAF